MGRAAHPETKSCFPKTRGAGVAVGDPPSPVRRRRTPAASHSVSGLETVVRKSVLHLNGVKSKFEKGARGAEPVTAERGVGFGGYRGRQCSNRHKTVTSQSEAAIEAAILSCNRQSQAP